MKDLTRKFGENFGAFISGSFRSALLLFLSAYRTIGTTHLGGSCRFEPSCSEYALEAARMHPPHKAARLIVGRVLRCRPGAAWGFDPVPPLGLPPVSKEMKNHVAR